MIRSQAHWHSAATAKLPSELADWLTDKGSLTLRLRQTSQKQFSVDLQQTGWQKPLTEEALKLEQPLHENAYCREVILRDGDKARVFARTIVPRASYQALQAHLHIHHLGNRSLGEILFTDPAIKRGPLEVASLRTGQSLFELAKHNGIALDDKAIMWARRSCFYFAGNSLLVCEMFLPNQDWSE
ncbi:chorismate lyase [Methylophaga sp.]|uniref:chorismate--pyruvate lyase family protein n=1 Tax=Methylophaga sp. TaxID=2024840 RepID=UPI00271833AB|nr:chorismate lyase [Methylophaga sp.]MDO8826634.1 chorismate lyase [Methylophaga sp.]